MVPIIKLDLPQGALFQVVCYSTHAKSVPATRILWGPFPVRVYLTTNKLNSVTEFGFDVT